MADIIERKDSGIDHVEKPQFLLPDDLPLPEELAHLTQDEQRQMERRLTRRLDCTLLPVVFLLFLLNIL